MVLGGVDIFGGRGTILGPVLALVLIALLRGGLGLLQVSDDVANLMVGCLLIFSILLPHVVQQVRTGRSQAEHPEGAEALQEGRAMEQHTRRRRGGEHQDVLDPLLRPQRIPEGVWSA